MNGAHAGGDQPKEHDVITTSTDAVFSRFRRMATGALIAVAAGASMLALGAPVATAEEISVQVMCAEHPEAYGQFAVYGIYSTQKHGLDRIQTCRVYDADGKLQGERVVTDRGYYAGFYRPVPPMSARN
jgi:hypothetical protein